LHVLASNYGNN